MTSVLRLATLSFASSCLRQLIPALRLGLCFLGNPACYALAVWHLLNLAVGTYSSYRPLLERVVAGYPVPDNRWLNG